MLVQEKMLDVVGNNLANCDTAGFRARIAVNKSFPEVLADRVEHHRDYEFETRAKHLIFNPGGRVPIGDISLANVLHYTAMRTEMGPMQVTDAPLDAAIAGDGFFVIDDRRGNTFYTRAGHFNKSNEGQLVTHEGFLVQGDGGPIDIPEDATRIFIDNTGQVIADGEAVGQLQIMRFENPSYMQQVGRTMLAETTESGGPEEVDQPDIVGGVLERSNVNIVEEMVRMIEANRAYEAAGKAVTIQDEQAGRMIQSVLKPTT